MRERRSRGALGVALGCVFAFAALAPEGARRFVSVLTAVVFAVLMATLPKTGKAKRLGWILAMVSVGSCGFFVAFYDVKTDPGSIASQGSTQITSSASDRARTPVLGLEFMQDGVKVRLEDLPWKLENESTYFTRVKLKSAAFEISVPSLKKDTAVQICAWRTPQFFFGSPVANGISIPCLEQGTGLAAAEYGDGILWITNYGHNYLSPSRMEQREDGSSRILFSQVEECSSGSHDCRLSPPPWGTVFLTVTTLSEPELVGKKRSIPLDGIDFIEVIFYQ